MLSYLAGAKVSLSTTPVTTNLGVDAAVVEVSNLSDILIWFQVDGDANDDLSDDNSIPIPAQSTRAVRAQKAGNTKVRAKTDTSTATVVISGWR